MVLQPLGSLIFNSHLGQFILSAVSRLLYFDFIRKIFVRIAERLIIKSKIWDESKYPGWGKIHIQYREIFLAVLNSLDRTIGNRILTPHVAGVILKLWGQAVFPSRSRKEILRSFYAENKAIPPWFLVISPTQICNLACIGCYANSGPGIGPGEVKSLDWDLLDRIITEARQLWGIPLFIFSGGEPMAYRSQGKDLLDIVEKHHDCLFLMFTNGTLINHETAQRLYKSGNLTPCLSVEGFEEETDQRRGEGLFRQVLEAMARLREVGIPFGISMTATRANCEQLLSDQLLDFFIQKQGAFYGFIFHYMPIGRLPNLDWMPTPEQRIPFWRRSREVIQNRRIFLLDFWNHGPLVEGCIAAGREKGYFHVDWNGNVMPCVFMPYIAANLPNIFENGGTLADVYHTPLFDQIRQWQRNYGFGRKRLHDGGNWMLPCPFRDHFATIKEWAASMQLQPEEGVAPTNLLDESFCLQMSEYGSEQAKFVQELWEKEFLEYDR